MSGTLSVKEKLILERLADGSRSIDICSELRITLSTFYTYCDRARMKLGVATTAAAVRKIVEDRSRKAYENL